MNVPITIALEQALLVPGKAPRCPRRFYLTAVSAWRSAIFDVQATSKGARSSVVYHNRHSISVCSSNISAFDNIYDLEQVIRTRG